MTVTLLVKFYNKKEYADKMLAGELCAGRLRAYRDTEDQARRDPSEGVTLWKQAVFTLRTSEGKSWTIPPEDLDVPVKLQPNVLGNLNVFSMTALRLDLGSGSSLALGDHVLQQVDESLRICREQFGDHAVIICANLEEFKRRVVRAAERKNWQVCSQHVTYYDSYPLDAAFGRDGSWSFAAAFLKPMRFRLEREFRVAMNTGTMGDNRVTLDIGSIRDIALYAKARELGRLIQSAQWRML